MATESQAGTACRQSSKPTRARSGVSKRRWLAKRTAACWQGITPRPRLAAVSRSELPARDGALARAGGRRYIPCPSVLCLRRSCWKSRTGAGCAPRGCVPIPGRRRYGAKAGDFSAVERNTGFSLVPSFQQVTSDPFSTRSGAPAANWASCQGQARRAALLEPEKWAEWVFKPLQPRAR